jgi:hypothetical protein
VCDFVSIARGDGGAVGNHISVYQKRLPYPVKLTNLNTKISNRRIDCIFQNLDYPPDPKYLLVEVKSFDSKQSKTTKGDLQGSFKWNMARLEDTLRENPRFRDMSENEMDDLLYDIQENHQSLLYTKKAILNPDKTIVEPEIWRLDDQGIKIENVTYKYMK